MGAPAGQIVCLGEGMLELTGADDSFRLGHGGDTLNTAIHLARAGHDVAFFSALGTDPFSARLRAAWMQEGVDDRLILTHPTRGAGLYAITTDAQGERSFTYWRDTSAARALFALPETAQAVAAVAQARLLYFSLISLAILPEAGREAVLTLAAQVRADLARPRHRCSQHRPAHAGRRDRPHRRNRPRHRRHALGRPGLPTHGGESRPGKSRKPSRVPSASSTAPATLCITV